MAPKMDSPQPLWRTQFDKQLTDSLVERILKQASSLIRQVQRPTRGRRPAQQHPREAPRRTAALGSRARTPRVVSVLGHLARNHARDPPRDEAHARLARRPGAQSRTARRRHHGSSRRRADEHARGADRAVLVRVRTRDETSCRRRRGCARARRRVCETSDDTQRGDEGHRHVEGELPRRVPTDDACREEARRSDARNPHPDLHLRKQRP
jgi:hypothetical protein